MLQKYLKDTMDINEEKQIIPIATVKKVSSNINAVLQGDFVNTKKLLLVDYEVDNIKNTYLSNQTGAKTIKIREDLVKDLNSIKKQLNNYGIPLSCQSFNISLDNQYISDLARVGLEIRLNPYAALTETKNPEYSDYYIGPDSIMQNRLRVYGTALKDFSFNKTKYKPFKKVLDIFDIRQTYLKYPPEKIKVFKNLLDITKIFEDHGFLQREPEIEFFQKSDNLKSNWFVFFKPEKINIGYTYKELLSTVYENNGESIWLISDKIWDGGKFK